VIEKRHAGVGARRARAVEIELDGDRGLLRGARDGGGAAHPSSLIACRNRSVSCSEPAVTRKAFGTTAVMSRTSTPRSRSPCHTVAASPGGTNSTKLASLG